MNFSNNFSLTMSLNKFGRSTKAPGEVKVIRTQNLFALTKEGHYDLQNHKLCNVQAPTEDTDVATKRYVDVNIVSVMESIDKKIKEIKESLTTDINKEISTLHQLVLNSTQTESISLRVTPIIDQKVSSVQTEINNLREEFQKQMKLLTLKLYALDSEHKNFNTALGNLSSKKAPQKTK